MYERSDAICGAFGLHMKLWSQRNQLAMLPKDCKHFKGTGIEEVAWLTLLMLLEVGIGQEPSCLLIWSTKLLDKPTFPFHRLPLHVYVRVSFVCWNLFFVACLSFSRCWCLPPKNQKSCYGSSAAYMSCLSVPATDTAFLHEYSPGSYWHSVAQRKK